MEDKLKKEFNFQTSKDEDLEICYKLIERSSKATWTDEYDIERENSFRNYWYKDVVKTKNLDLVKFFIDKLKTKLLSYDNSFSSDYKENMFIECLTYSESKEMTEYLLLEYDGNLKKLLKSCLNFSQSNEYLKDILKKIDN
jgi:hypothetical protein